VIRRLWSAHATTSGSFPEPLAAKLSSGLASEAAGS